jgi:hypothetical protein
MSPAAFTNQASAACKWKLFEIVFKIMTLTSMFAPLMHQYVILHIDVTHHRTAGLRLIYLQLKLVVAS